jgi:hypothetical protein
MVDAVSGEELIKHRYVATEPKLNQMRWTTALFSARDIAVTSYTG